MDEPGMTSGAGARPVEPAGVTGEPGAPGASQPVPAPAERRRKVSRAWVVLACVAGVALGVLAAKAVPPIFGTITASYSESVVRSLKPIQEVAVLSVGHQQVLTENRDGRVGPVRIPGTGKSVILLGSFDAKFGFDGADVGIDHIGDHEYRVTVPEFRLIGMADIKFETLDQDTGILSLFTKDIDTLEMVNKALKGDEAIAGYIDKYQDLLKQSTEGYFMQIAKALDPDASLTFVYRGARG